MIALLCIAFLAKGLALGAWLGYRRGYANGVRDEALEQEMDDRLRRIFEDGDDAELDLAALATTISASGDFHGLDLLPPDFDSRA